MKIPVANKYWKWIPGYENRYMINRSGVVRRTSWYGEPCNEIIKPSIANGYSVVGLATGKRMNMKNKAFAVHRLVAITFIPNPESLPEVNHIDHNKQNNHASNLEWVSHRDNVKHSWRNPKRKANEYCYHRVLNFQPVKEDAA